MKQPRGKAFRNVFILLIIKSATRKLLPFEEVGDVAVGDVTVGDTR